MIQSSFAYEIPYKQIWLIEYTHTHTSIHRVQQNNTPLLINKVHLTTPQSSETQQQQQKIASSSRVKKNYSIEQIDNSLYIKKIPRTASRQDVDFKIFHEPDDSEHETTLSTSAMYLKSHCSISLIILDSYALEHFTWLKLTPCWVNKCNLGELVPHTIATYPRPMCAMQLYLLLVAMPANVFVVLLCIRQIVNTHAHTCGLHTNATFIDPHLGAAA